MHPPCKLTDAEDRYRLTQAMETALWVQTAKDFFAWSQGPLFMLLPHEILMCGYAKADGNGLDLRYFSATRYFRQEHFDAACHPHSGLVNRTIKHWLNTPRPCMLPMHGCDEDVAPAAALAPSELLTRLELKNLAAHGITGPGGELLAWFGFSRVKNLGPHTALLLELLLPTLAATYGRVLASEARLPVSAGRNKPLLSGRELQVLELVRAGKSNGEIAAALGLSVLTAKNHVQNIRGKLGVHTRSQAVAEAIRLGLMYTAAGED